MKASRSAGTRLVFLASDCYFASAVFAAALDAGLSFDCVLVYRRSTATDTEPLPILATTGAGSLARRARARQISCYSVSGDPATMTRLLRARDGGMLLSVCYPLRLPASVYETLPYAWNVHPSLLPRYRGPAPLFWQLRDGAARAGISLHELSDRIDAGAIVAQKAVTLRNGLSLSEIELSLAPVAVEILQRALAGHCSPRRQNEAEATRQGDPAAEDFLLHAGWRRMRAFNFVRAFRRWCHPIGYRTGERYYEIDDLDFQPTEGSVPVAFADGCLWAVVRSR